MQCRSISTGTGYYKNEDAQKLNGKIKKMTVRTKHNNEIRLQTSSALEF
jgi:hypothetical protein